MPSISETDLHHSFVVRFWSEPGQLSQGMWRASIEHVATHQKMYFTSLVDMNDFITFILKRNPNPDEPLESFDR
jgi:hypothetical protein